MTPLTLLTRHPLLKGKVNPDLILVSIYLDGSGGSEGAHYANSIRFAPTIGHLYFSVTAPKAAAFLKSEAFNGTRCHQVQIVKIFRKQRLGSKVPFRSHPY